VATAAYLAVLAVLAVYGGHRLSLTARAWRARAPDPAPPPPAVAGPLPVVTVQLPLYNERYVAERLIDAVAALDWPRDRLEIQILDDSTDDTSAICAARAAALAERGFDVCHLRRADRTGFKAGALETGLARARGELLLILDADFVPPPDLLRRSVGHFADPEVGMVQVRWEHLNRQASALTRVQALLLDGHFAIEQKIRARTGRFFNFNGTAGVWRRRAVADAGGWHHDTLTEDLDLSYRALLAGWRFVYLDGVAAPAELPADMRAFKSQQFRWAKGSVEVARKLLPAVLRAPLPWRVKVEALFHLTQNVPYLLTLLLVLLVVPALVFERGASVAPWLALPLLCGTAVTMAAWCMTSQRALGRSGLWALAALPVYMAVTAGICVSQSHAVVEGALGHRSAFVRTPKHGDAGAWRRKRYRGPRSLAPAAELCLAAYLAAALVVASLEGLALVAPILAVLAAGFGYVGVRSLTR
jgi:cellulose synthase/poly-beta-1,6-N-acetylglucosamine synthase-like glycosyltransferase